MCKPRVPDRLLLDSNHAHRNLSPVPLREFQTRPLRLFFRLERLRLRRELTIDILEEKPLFDYFRHFGYPPLLLLHSNRPLRFGALPYPESRRLTPFTYRRRPSDDEA